MLVYNTRIKREQLLEREVIAVNTNSETPNKSSIPPITDWLDVKWRKAEKYVEKLQQRIFRAEKMNGTIRFSP